MDRMGFVGDSIGWHGDSINCIGGYMWSLVIPHGNLRDMKVWDGTGMVYNGLGMAGYDMGWYLMIWYGIKLYGMVLDCKVWYIMSGYEIVWDDMGCYRMFGNSI